jgi:hypothetical protein
MKAWCVGFTLPRAKKWGGWLTARGVGGVFLRDRSPSAYFTLLYLKGLEWFPSRNKVISLHLIEELYHTSAKVSSKKCESGLSYTQAAPKSRLAFSHPQELSP